MSLLELIDTLLVYVDAANPMLYVTATPQQEEIGHTLNRVALALGLLVLVVSEVTRNYSQVDKLWSIVPPTHAWVVAYLTGFADQRVVLMSVLATVWGARLSYNFYLRDGYPKTWRLWEGVEDYRWNYVRKWPVFQLPLVWFIFNVTFISTIQMYILLSLTLPAVYVVGSDTPLGVADLTVSALFLLLVGIETLADQQQFSFQTEKYRLINAKLPLPHPYNRGFITSGLWGYSRHPNYASEVSLWWAFSLFAFVAGASNWLYATAGGSVMLLLFFGSSDLSEGISAAKYPDYSIYQKTVSRFWPTPLSTGYPIDKKTQ